MSQRLHVSKHSIIKPTTHPELKELDARLKRITDDIILPSPYILTVPSERPYRLDPRLPHDWQRDTPFEENEEQLQYLSFLADWDEGLILPVGGWEDYYETPMERTHSQQSVKSGVSGTGGGVKKIKYSLSDYKKKAAGQPVTGEARESGAPTKVNGTSGGRRGSSSSRQGDRGIKRSREDGEISEASEDIPLKRRRSTPIESATPPPPKHKSPIPKLELPPEISPTLPPIFERELARLSKIDRLDSATAAKSSDQPSEKRKVADKGISSTKSDSLSRQKDDAKPRPKGADHSSSGAPNGISAKPKPETTSNGPSKPRKIVKIRIPKSIRNNVKRLLKIPPRSQKKADPVSKGVARKIERSPPHRDRSNDRDKRRRDDDSDRDDEHRMGSIKRAKHPNNLEFPKSNASSNPAFRSPAVSTQSGPPKSSTTADPLAKTLAVPRDDGGGGASTPLGGHRNGTPTAPDSAERPSKDGRPTSRAQRSAAYTELRQVEKDMFTLGRSSKHSSDRELNTEGASPSPRRVMRGLAFGLECILAFMLSYTVRDEMNRLMPPATDNNAGTETTWATIFPYIQRIKRVAQTNEHKHLHGLCLQLEAVCHLAVLHSDVDRAAADSAPHHTNTLMKHYHAAATLFADGTAALPVDALQHSFPRTWTGKSATPLACGNRTAASSSTTSGGGGGNGTTSSSSSTKFDPHPIGEFALPITSITTGVEAVRAGRALLVEWCERQKLDWTPSLGGGRTTKRKDEPQQREQQRERER